MYRIAVLIMTGLGLALAIAWAGAGPATAAQSGASASQPCVDDPASANPDDCIDPEPPPPPPPPPPCDLDAAPGRPQAPCPTAKYEFMADDPAQSPPDSVCVPDFISGCDYVDEELNYVDRSVTRCEVTLEGATPTDGIGHKIQYRGNVLCDGPVRKITFTALAYSGAPDAGGQLLGSGPTLSCYVCTSAGPSRGADFAISTNKPYTIRVYIRMLAPESLRDPWAAVSGTNKDNPAMCAPGGEEVACNVDLPISTP